MTFGPRPLPLCTAADFAAVGVVIRGDGTIEGPKGRQDIFDQLRAEVLRRVPMVGKRDPEAGYGVCATCGDRMPDYRAGDCPLCVLAIRKAAA